MMQTFVLSPDISNSQANLLGPSGVFQGLVFNPSGTVTNASITSWLHLNSRPFLIRIVLWGLVRISQFSKPSTSQELDNPPRVRSKSRNDLSHHRRRRRHSSSSSLSGSSHSPRRKRKSHQQSNDVLSQPVGMLSSLP